MSSGKSPSWLKLCCLAQENHPLVIQLLLLGSNSCLRGKKVTQPGNSAACDCWPTLWTHCCSHEMQLICAAKHPFLMVSWSISRNWVQCSLSHFSGDCVPHRDGASCCFPTSWRAHPSSYSSLGSHCTREQMHTIQLFLRNSSVFKLQNLIQMRILLVTPFILFS